MGKLIESAIHNRYGVDVISGSYFYNNAFNPLKLRDKIGKIKNNYDYVVIDSSPNLNEEILSAMLASDALFVVTTGDYPTMSCSMRAAYLAKQRGKPIVGIILNKIRDPAFELSMNEIEEATGIPVVAKIPDEPHHTKALFTRIPMSLFKNNSKFSKEINALDGAITGEKKSIKWYHQLLPLNLKKEKVNREIMKDKFYNSIFNNTYNEDIEKS